MKPLLKIGIFTVLTISSLQITYSQSSFNRLDQIIIDEMAVWCIPGLSIAIVKDKDVVYSGGFGFADMSDGRQVTEHTIFPIASVTKTFTATLMAKLLADKSLEWDQNVSFFFPDFRLENPYLSNNITVRDILSHRTGLPGNDLLWYGNQITSIELLEKINLLVPTTSFRSSFQYNNLMYLLAGKVIENLDGRSYELSVKEHLLDPLNLTSTFTQYDEVHELTNYAKPYGIVRDSIVEAPHLELGMILPAGGIYSTVTDLSKWLIFLMQESGKSIRFQKFIEDTHSPQIPFPDDPFVKLMFPESEFISYGMGWFVHSFRGKKVIEHTGNTDGYSTHLVMMPDEKIGIAILTNLNTNFYSFALRNKILDVFLSKKEKDWNNIVHEGFYKFLKLQEEITKEKELKRLIHTTPSFPLNDYTGNFSHAFYGNTKIESKRDQLNVSFLNGLRGKASHWHYNTFKIKWDNSLLGESYLNFNISDTGSIDKLTIDRVGLFPLQEEFIKD